MVMATAIAQAVVSVGLLSMILVQHYGLGGKVVYARVRRSSNV